MFLTLLAVTFVIAVLVAAIVAWLFSKPIKGILKRIIADDISGAWNRYIIFAIFVVGISSGTRIWQLERYVTPEATDKPGRLLTLTTERWVLELYRTVIESLQGIAWMLLVFFLVALVAYVIVRAFELKRG
ncbi:hypothetical protein [Roseateles sp. LYH14W]|uniref:Uncharacterized protein n=1 Tax=Pelomonas parva TaxID=3299032 RepID=A0ABW7F1E2_9BURK